jgi:low temperature requirement protein LtrA
MSGPSPDDLADEERHATNLELFLDLVFVFAVTQITTMLSHDLSWPGVGRASLVSWLVWWQWSQFTWAGAAVDLQRRPVTRLLVLFTIPATLVMAVAIPTAFASAARWFGAAYLGVQLLVLAMQGSEAMKSPATRRAFIMYASFASIAPVLVLVGAFFPADVRTAVWIAASLVNIAGALRGAGEGEWAVNPVHFAERHALFVIIALGEVLVAVGATASALGLAGAVLLGLAAAVAGACVIWWTYFVFIPAVAEHALREATGPQRGLLARDVFTFGHFPIVAGIICYAVVVKHVVPHATQAIGGGDRAMLLAAAALILGGYLHIELRVRGRWGLERLLAMAAVGAWCALAGAVPGAAVVAGATVIIAVATALSWRRSGRHAPA